MLAADGEVNQATNYGNIPLHISSENDHLVLVNFLIANKSNFLYKDYNGGTPLDVAKTDEIKQFILNHLWYHRQPLLMTYPHSDYETNKDHKLYPLGEIITATRGSVSDPRSK